MNVFFRMSAEQVLPPSGSLGFQNRVVASYEAQLGFAFDKKYKNNIPGNLGAFDRTMGLRIDEVSDGGHGTVELSRLNSEFFGPSSPITEDLAGAFVFAVIDHNSAHHLSYVLARRSLAGNAAPRKVVVNFDRHQDYGSASPNIGCNTWAYFTRNGATRFADSYVAVGTFNPTGDNAAKYSCAVDSGAAAVWLANTDELLAQLGIGPATTPHDIALYVTVDRDWTTYSHTPYGDGYYPYDSGYRDFLLPFLARVRPFVVSIDVIGLPSARGHSTYGGAHEHSPNDYGLVAAEHVRSIHAVL